jgi:Fur family zinc uptake transcriptional regulator
MRDDFSQATRHLLDLAGERCTRRGARLTDLRRDVLGLILESASPSGAYDLLERLRGLRGSPVAPPTVYRALDFLVEHGFIHRVERLAAFVGCIGTESHSDGHGRDHVHQHAAQFLICTTCKRVAEIEDHAIAHALAAAASRIGFRLERSTIEAEGLCAACAAIPAPSLRGA